MSNAVQNSSKLTGYSLAFTAALFWGASGTLAQYLFQHRDITPEWLVAVRSLIAGLLLLSIPLLRNPKSLLAPWKNKKDILSLLSFSIFGMLAVQYTYFEAIKQSNAATATILQYLGPVFIAFYYAFISKRLPQLKEVVAIVLALTGAFLIVTHGSFESLSISREALFWGVLSAIALGTYSILPIGLMNRYEASVIVGWGTFLGGVVLSLIRPPWTAPGQWDSVSYVFTSSIILFGTAIAFYCYLNSVKIVGATVASLLACAEPLTAAVIAVLWLNVSFGFYDWLGTFCILMTIVILTTVDKKPSLETVQV